MPANECERQNPDNPLAGQRRDVNAELYEIQLQKPGRLLSVVAHPLQLSNSRSSQEEVLKRN